MSIAESFRNFLVAENLATADNVTVSRIAAVNLSEDDQWALVASGGQSEGGNVSRWKKKYNLTILHRSTSGPRLYAKDDTLQQYNDQCIVLSPYKVIRVTISPMTELDMSDERTHVGNWQAEITTHSL